jgi:DNA-binding NarL/FixJ family response regulator
MHSTQSVTPVPSHQAGPSQTLIDGTAPTTAEENVFTADGEPTATTLLILRLMGTGATERVIARALGTSTRTLQRRVARLQELIGVHSRFQLGMVAASRGWLRSSDPRLESGDPRSARR